MKPGFQLALAILLFLPLALAPYLGIAFGIVWALSAVLTFAPIDMSATASPFFTVGCYIYGALAALSLFVYFTFDYRESGAAFFGGVSPWGFVRQKGWRSLELAASALCWPYTWFMFDRHMSAWGYAFGDIVIQAFRFWLVERRRGFELTMVDFRKGTTVTSVVKDGDQAITSIRDAILANDDEE